MIARTRLTQRNARINGTRPRHVYSYLRLRAYPRWWMSSARGRVRAALWRAEEYA